jgi:V/A-type H+-transporting ATPase subunit C
MITERTKAILNSEKPIHVSMSPYTYVRTTVMAARLFNEDDYRKLLKLSLPEMIQMLEESAYQKEIDELATTESGTFLVEHVVARNFWRTVDKLRRISGEELRFFIDVYLWRNDIQNIKTVLRAKRGGETEARIRNIVLPGTITKQELFDLLALPSVEAILAAIDLPFMDDPLATYTREGLEGLETELTHRYYQITHRIARRIPDPTDRFKQFLLLEVDLTNILTILKLKRRGLSLADIEPFLIDPYGELPKDAVTVRHRARKAFLGQLASAADINETITLLASGRYADVFKGGAEAYRKSGSLLELEREAQAHLLKRAAILSHQRPLQADSVLSYLFAKVIETRNILVLSKGKDLGVDAAFLAQELIIRSPTTTASAS